MVKINKIIEWIDMGIKSNAETIAIVSDDVNYKFFPIFFSKKENIKKKIETEFENNIKVMEMLNIEEYCKEHNIKYDINGIKKLNDSLLREEFLVRMEEELDKNQHKGHWKYWHPTKEEWLWEMNSHVFRLQEAIQTKDYEKVKEYSADIANIAEKSYTEFGEKE